MFFHYPKQSKTLADILKASKKRDADEVQEVVAVSEQALLEAIQEDGAEGYEFGSIDMLYYSSVALVKSLPSDAASDENNRLAANEILSDSWGSADLEDGVLKVIHICDAIVDFVISLDEVDVGHLEWLSDFIEDGGSVADVVVLVSVSFLSCGFGCFWWMHRFLFQIHLTTTVRKTSLSDEG